MKTKESKGRMFRECCPLCATENEYLYSGVRIYRCRVCGFAIVPCTLCNYDINHCEYCRAAREANIINQVKPLDQ